MNKKVPVVVIGRNEGERLRRCLASLNQEAWPLVYVDSGSTDGSIDLAHSLGVDVVELEPSLPFTAARARNAGLKRLLEFHPDVEYVQFVDGDCEIITGWCGRGLEEMRSRKDAAVVVGNIRERFPYASIYNRICNIEWQAAVGEVEGCGGIALMRVSALEEVNGFDPTIIAAEDTELCVRLRTRGWKILHIDVEMARHDAAMTQSGQWWARAVRAGYGYARFSRLRGAPSSRFFVRFAGSTWFWGFIVPFLVLVLVWPTHGWSLTLLGGYPVLMCRIFRRMRRKGTPQYESMLYALHCALAKFPQMVGIFAFHLRRLRRRPDTIIEHKQPVRVTVPIQR